MILAYERALLYRKLPNMRIATMALADCILLLWNS